MSIKTDSYYEPQKTQQLNQQQQDASVQQQPAQFQSLEDFKKKTAPESPSVFGFTSDTIVNQTINDISNKGGTIVVTPSLEQNRQITTPLEQDQQNGQPQPVKNIVDIVGQNPNNATGSYTNVNVNHLPGYRDYTATEMILRRADAIQTQNPSDTLTNDFMGNPLFDASLKGHAEAAAGVAASLESMFSRRVPSIFDLPSVVQERPGMAVGLVAGEALQFVAMGALFKGIEAASEMKYVSKFVEVPRYSKTIVKGSATVEEFAEKGVTAGVRQTTLVDLMRKDTGILQRVGGEFVDADKIGTKTLEFAKGEGNVFVKVSGEGRSFALNIEKGAGSKIASSSETIYNMNSKPYSFIARERITGEVSEFKPFFKGAEESKLSKVSGRTVTWEKETSIKIGNKMPKPSASGDLEDVAKIVKNVTPDDIKLPKPSDQGLVVGGKSQPGTLLKTSEKASEKSVSKLFGIVEEKAGQVFSSRTISVEEGISFGKIGATFLAGSLASTYAKSSTRTRENSVPVKPDNRSSETTAETVIGKTIGWAGSFSLPQKTDPRRDTPPPEPRVVPTPNVITVTTGGGYTPPPPPPKTTPTPNPTPSDSYRWNFEVPKAKRYQGKDDYVPRFVTSRAFKQKQFVNPWNMNPLGEVTWQKGKKKRFIV